MENNYVRLVGTVKKAAENESGRLTFTLEVVNEKGTKLWFDCLCTHNSNAYVQLDGFVNEGEFLEIEGHLIKNVSTQTGKLGNTRIEVKTTNVMVYVDEVATEEEE